MQERLTKRQNFLQVIKFVLFSASAGIVETIVFTLCKELFSWPYWPSYLTALILSVLYNFTLNRRFTFKSAANVPIAMLKLGIYYAIFTPLSTWLGNLLVGIGINDYIVLFGTMLVNLTTEFLVSRFIIYNGQLNTRA